MKFSQFNTFVPLEDKMLCYNAFTDKYLLLEPMLYEMVDAAKHRKMPEEINEVHPSFYDALIQNGVIVDTDVDEIDKVRQLIASYDQCDTSYRLIINPTMNCNFKCWYCYETHIKESRMDEAMVEKTCKFIQNTIEQNSSLQHFLISFFGGEPLLYYQKVVLPILQFTKKVCDEKGITMSGDFTTNGYLINDSMTEEFIANNVHSFQITLDGNKEMHDLVRFVNKSKGSYDEIMSNILLLARRQFTVTLRVNYTKTNLEKIDEILEDLQTLEPEFRANIGVSLHQVWQDDHRDLAPVVNAFLNKVRTLGFSAGHGVLGDTVRYSCYADRSNHATINYNGEVFKCTARDFTSASKEGDLDEDGNIIWNERYTDRMTSKLKNKPCLECAILPICGGGCSQKAMESANEDYCVHFFDENRKKNIIRDRFRTIVEENLLQEA